VSPQLFAPALAHTKLDVVTAARTENTTWDGGGRTIIL
jgi:hypothetical protein